MIDVISTSTEPLNTWLADSSGNIAASGAGLALLEAEITHFHTSASEESNSPNESEAEA
jgi:hypothetical protein